MLWLGEVEKLNFENQDQTYYDIKQWFSMRSAKSRR